MILFVGDKPSPKMKPGAKPFEGAACEKRLKDWICYLLDYTELESLLRDSNPWTLTNCSSPVFTFDLSIAKFAGWKIIALGNVASIALEKIVHFKLPHPSGRNRQINDKEFIKKKLEECKAWLKHGY